MESNQYAISDFQDGKYYPVKNSESVEYFKKIINDLVPKPDMFSVNKFINGISTNYYFKFWKKGDTDKHILRVFSEMYETIDPIKDKSYIFQNYSDIAMSSNSGISTSGDNDECDNNKDINKDPKKIREYLVSILNQSYNYTSGYNVNVNANRSLIDDVKNFMSMPKIGVIINNYVSNLTPYFYDEPNKCYCGSCEKCVKQEFKDPYYSEIMREINSLKRIVWGFERKKKGDKGDSTPRDWRVRDKVVSGRDLRLINLSGTSELIYGDGTLDIVINDGQKGDKGDRGKPTPENYNIKGNVVNPDNIKEIEFNGTSEMTISKENDKITIVLNDGKTGEKGDRGKPTPEKYIVDGDEVESNSVDVIEFSGTAFKTIKKEDNKIMIEINDGKKGEQGVSHFEIGTVQASLLRRKPFIIGEWATTYIEDEEPIKTESYQIDNISIPLIKKSGTLVQHNTKNSFGNWVEGRIKEHNHYFSRVKGISNNYCQSEDLPDQGFYAPQGNTDFCMRGDEFIKLSINSDIRRDPETYARWKNEPCGIEVLFYVYVGENAKLTLDVNSGNFSKYLDELDKLGCKRTQENGGNNERYTFRGDALELFKEYKEDLEVRLNKDFPKAQHIFNDNSILIDYLYEYEIFKYIYAFCKY